MTTVGDARKRGERTLAAYIAGPLFNDHEKWFLEQIDKVCKELGIDTFLPHRDTHFDSEVDTVGIFKADVRGLVGKGLIIALLDGQDIDSGTATELGIAYCNSMPAIGITTDTIRRSYSNAMPTAICEMSLGIVHSLEQLKAELSEFVMKRKGLR